jgi:hypothetical protein
MQKQAWFILWVAWLGLRMRQTFSNRSLVCVKQSENDRYVTLYPQETNCAILYAPDSSAASAPLHSNPSRPDWQQDVFDRLAGAVEWMCRDNKGPGKDVQNFNHYRVVN